ncbi:rhodanese-like domain-containing protein [Brevibacillus nitrificans]|uniref:rhodanese-like domain-containing protein n=1 Tax=Brevibacillus nitrificans TaxID=651560 RepID=UPI00285C476D|nr:rhodanese-like domain-containing protein [Brevibacillus nitrificans]MDR7315693.1 rhodanese-related sulfurtransferase [Brevibacillus nitrificans]
MSLVLQSPAALPQQAAHHFLSKLSVETDVADVWSDLQNGVTDFQLLVVYCWSPACNGATKGAAKLAALGFRVKEMIGGMEYWRREGNPVEGTLGTEAPSIG